MEIVKSNGKTEEFNGPEHGPYFVAFDVEGEGHPRQRFEAPKEVLDFLDRLEDAILPRLKIAKAAWFGDTLSLIFHERTWSDIHERGR